MDLLEPDDVPLTVHEDILKYLKEQDLFSGEDEEFAQTITNFTEAQIKEILEVLLQKFERNQKLKEEYEERVLDHNQYALFRLENILPEFEIDDEMFEALTFRETLIINRLVGDATIVPEPVGGLCLDIQQAPGRPPPERKLSNINSRLSKIFLENKNAEVVQLDDIKVRNEEYTDIEVKSPNLEDSLELQSSRSLSKFLVHLSSQFDLDGYNAGSTITAWVDKNLHTLEEARREFYTAKEVKTATLLGTSVEMITEQSSDRLQKNKSCDKDQRSRSKRLSKKASEPVQKKLSDGSSRQVGPESVGKTDQDEQISKLRSTSHSQQIRKQASHASSKQNLEKKMSGLGSEKSQMHKEESEIPDKDKAEGSGDETKATIRVIDKNLYVGLFKRFYYVKHLCSEDKVDSRKFYSLHKAKDYISEGANFILQRYLAKTIYIGSFELSTMYINGDMCRNLYNCTGPESEVINDRRIDVCKIYRTIIEECGIEHKCTTVLTLQGQIIHQTWEGTGYTLQINPLLDLTNCKPVGNEQVLLKHAWESDMQLMSKYLDAKIENDIKVRSYMIDHPEFRNIISDYIHTILLLKPEDILEFTISHFLSFAPQYLPQNDYFNGY